MPFGKGKPRKKRLSSYSLLFEIFCGNYVNIFVKNIKSVGGRQGKINNVMLAGFLLDEDDEFYFLGQTPDDVFCAVKKDEIAALMLGEEGIELMEQIEVPDGQEVQ